MLPRPLGEIYEFLRDFVIALDEQSGDVVGCCALHVVWEDLAEVRSLAVDDAHRGTGLGRRLVEACIAEACRLGIKRLFALTYVPGFFKKLGFHDLPKETLPHKVWSDCIKCHKFPDCDEQAVALDLTT
jgi:amino-acid N-acetyltransferase